MVQDGFTFYSKSEYLQDITDRINNLGQGHRVSLATLTLMPDDVLVAPLIEALCRAASRGAKVILLADAFNFLFTTGKNSTTPGPLFFRRELSELAHSKHPIMQAIKRLRDAGGQAQVINFPRQILTNPFAGRSHLKLAVINDRVYLGGCNLDTSTEIDIMTGWEDAATAGWLYDISQMTCRRGHVRDAIGHSDIDEPLEDGGHILIDCGKPTESIIYRTALDLIDRAQKTLVITCQYFPNHITAHHLTLAHERGVKVTIIYNHPGKDTWPFNLVHRGVVRFERLRRPPGFFAHELPKGTPFLHAKVLASESSAIIGSHNYVRAGVTWGTAEIALLRHDPVFARALIRKVQSLI